MDHSTCKKTMLHSAIGISNPNILSTFNFTFDVTIYNCDRTREDGLYLLDSEIPEMKKRI